MILQALTQYYVRKSADPDAHLAPPGFEWKEIPFVVEVNKQGKLVQVEDTRDLSGKTPRARSFLVAQAVKKTSGVSANLLWDNAEYVLGVAIKGKLKRVSEQHQAFIQRITDLPKEIQNDSGVAAVRRFLDELDPNGVKAWPQWTEIGERNANLTFRLQGDIELVCQRPSVRAFLEYSALGRKPDGICLVTGERDEIERLHASIKGIWGAQTTGANIVSFNLEAFNSYGKSQGANAPVGKQATFRYTTALNHLLRKGSPQRIQVGDASTVFWSEQASRLETSLADLFGEPPKDDPDRHTRAVRSLFASVHSGVLEPSERDNRFYVLGLAPNAARIAIRFWHVATVKEMATHIAQHFEDLEIVHAPREAPYPSLFRLLVGLAPLANADWIPPNLAGEFMRSILAGLPYPQTILTAAVGRIRAEREVGYARAALLKASLNRAVRYSNPALQEEIHVSLDPSNSSIGYRLGRLFAVLEKIQEEANPGINATIRDRYYGAASSTPVTAFPTLLKLKNHHVSKLDNRGRAVNFERLLGQILEGIGDIPAHLALLDQGRFAVGYYHQRQEFFKRQETTDTTEGE